MFPEHDNRLKTKKISPNNGIIFDTPKEGRNGARAAKFKSKLLVSIRSRNFYLHDRFQIILNANTQYTFWNCISYYHIVMWMFNSLLRTNRNRSQYMSVLDNLFQCSNALGTTVLDWLSLYVSSERSQRMCPCPSSPCGPVVDLGKSSEDSEPKMIQQFSGT